MRIYHTKKHIFRQSAFSNEIKAQRQGREFTTIRRQRGRLSVYDRRALDVVVVVVVGAVATR